MSRVFTKEKLDHIYIMSKFRVKIGSLAAEAKIIRREERKRSIYGWVPSSLRLHRIGIVREEQRAALLAYAYYRGKPYSQVEQGCKSDLPVSRVVSIMKSIAGRSGISASDIETWASA